MSVGVIGSERLDPPAVAVRLRPLRNWWGDDMLAFTAIQRLACEAMALDGWALEGVAHLHRLDVRHVDGWHRAVRFRCHSQVIIARVVLPDGETQVGAMMTLAYDAPEDAITTFVRGIAGTLAWEAWQCQRRGDVALLAAERRAQAARARAQRRSWLRAALGRRHVAALRAVARRLRPCEPRHGGR